MRKTLIFVLILITIGFVSSASDIPKSQDRYVNDFASILDQLDSGTIRQAFETVEQNTTAQVVFVSLDTTGGEDISQYATQLGQEWAVGQSDVDNGIVILYVKDLGKIWVSTGYGVEGILPDSKVGRMLDENYVPLRDEGKLSEGITQFSLVLSQELTKNSEEIRSGNASGPRSDIWPILIYIIIILIIFFINSRKKRGGLGLWPLFIPIGRSSGGGGSSFSGGFGGGGFGGGGAGR